MSNTRKIDGKFSGKYGVDGVQILNTVSGVPIPEDEPLFLLRARDHHALAAIDAYQESCEADCNELHRAGIQQTREKFCQFAAEHPERMKQPGITRHFKLEAESVSPAPQHFKTYPEAKYGDAENPTVAARVKWPGMSEDGTYCQGPTREFEAIYASLREEHDKMMQLMARLVEQWDEESAEAVRKAVKP